jgi:hypothetical protein
MRQHQRRDGVAGDHHEVRRVGVDQLPDHWHHPLNDPFLTVLAVGKVLVVGNVNGMRVGTRLDDLTQHRKAAEAGVEDENGGRMGHWPILSRSRLPPGYFAWASSGIAGDADLRSSGTIPSEFVQDEHPTCLVQMANSWPERCH